MCFTIKIGIHMVQTAIITSRDVAYDKFMEVISYIKKGYTIA